MSEKNNQLKVKANDFQFLFDQSEVEQLDLIRRSDTEFHVLRGHRSVRVLFHDPDPRSKKLRVEVDGESFDVEISDPLDQMLEKLGFNQVSGKHIKEIKAPMPGLVLSIAVSEGQEVQEGDKILILEAMKMENSLMIHANAKIKKILVKPGQAVEKNQVLVELE